VRAVSIISAIALMMETARISETSVDIYLTTRQHIPEDSKLHTRRLKNLKSHMNKTVALSKDVFATKQSVGWEQN
jgi:hypothetical protein